MSVVLQAFWVLQIAGNKGQDLGGKIDSFCFGMPRKPSFDWPQPLAWHEALPF